MMRTGGCSAAEGQNRLSELVRNQNLVIDRIVADVVHRAGQHGLLSCQNPGRPVGFLRHPGENRNLRVGHSVRNQDLVALAVVVHRAGVSVPIIRACLPTGALRMVRSGAASPSAVLE
jgi:hypothetical protein